MEKIKKGTVREDGLVFLKNHFNKEIWLTPNKFKLAWEKSKELRKNAPKKKTGHIDSQG
jgi:hypothetical protein